MAFGAKVEDYLTDTRLANILMNDDWKLTKIVATGFSLPDAEYMVRTSGMPSAKPTSISENIGGFDIKYAGKVNKAGDISCQFSENDGNVVTKAFYDFLDGDDKVRAKSSERRFELVFDVMKSGGEVARTYTIKNAILSDFDDGMGSLTDDPASGEGVKPNVTWEFPSFELEFK